ncbi:accessory factor UbiK family protein [Halioxenophilus sp. WMMB6]|uniref:accessory factor UbiK family protein n=1 Tax=Halioxenophilus sp. WMMB6 TaxID=3073815 RepID=UPI00295F3E14|nr:accessory factor UbiK family protein [Halioxenophilus sp. WMMB6]
MKTLFDNPLLDRLRELNTPSALEPVSSALTQRLLDRYQLVSRQEFDAQSRLLEKTEQHVLELEAQLAELEAKLQESP